MMRYFTGFILVLICYLSSGCMTTATLPEKKRPHTWATRLDQRYNFYQISPMLFRSERPNFKFAAQLQQHHIDVVINLRGGNLDHYVLDSTRYQLHQVAIHTWAINRKNLLDVMRIIQQAQQQQQKILIHCYHGSDRTGAAVAMYRIIFQHWRTEDALAEMQHGGYGFHWIWRNIPALFSPENIKWIREQLTNPSTFSSNANGQKMPLQHSRH